MIRPSWRLSSNPKLGKGVPTLYVGATLDEARDSCRGCPLAPASLGGGGGCYAHLGRVAVVYRAPSPGAPSLEALMPRVPRGVGIVRFGAIGDPSRLRRDVLLTELDTARANGLGVIGYTHFWAQEPTTGVLRRTFLASAETAEGAARAEALGWKVALAGPDRWPGYLTCPATKRDDVTCQDCKLCTMPLLVKSRAKGIVFPAHGQGKRRLPLAGRVS